MAFKYRNLNIGRTKCVPPLPLLMGFVFGLLSVYTYRLFANYENDRKMVSSAVERLHGGENNIGGLRRYYHVDLTKPSAHTGNASLLCLIFINDTDTVLLQHNVWLDKCGENKMYASKEKHKYIDRVVTDTYSTSPWKYYCQTLVHLHRVYRYGTVKYDWIFLAKDNVWLIYENLLHLVSLLNVDRHTHNFYAGQYVDGVLNIDAGVLLSASTLTSLVVLLNDMDACNTELTKSESQMLDFFMKKLDYVTPVSNLDTYGCTLFHSKNLFDTFLVESLRPEILSKCLSKSAITFQLELKPLSYHAMFYKYVLYKIRVVNKKDLMSIPNNILPASSSDDDNIWRIEALYELNLDPSNMSQTDFFYYWSKKRQIVL